MSKKKKSYTFDEYMDTFSPNTCRGCNGSGVQGSLLRRTLRPCEDCDGTGRKDRRTLDEVMRDALEKIRAA